MTHPNSLPAETGVVPAEAGKSSAGAETQALVPAPAAEVVHREPEPLPAAVALLAVELDVAVPLRSFRVKNLLALEPGQVVESAWGHEEDLPLAAGKVQLAWTEFEVVDTTLAVRVTRLA